MANTITKTDLVDRTRYIAAKRNYELADFGFSVLSAPTSPNAKRPRLTYCNHEGRGTHSQYCEICIPGLLTSSLHTPTLEFSQAKIAVDLTDRPFPLACLREDDPVNKMEIVSIWFNECLDHVEARSKLPIELRTPPLLQPDFSSLLGSKSSHEQEDTPSSLSYDSDSLLSSPAKSLFSPRIRSAPASSSLSSASEPSISSCSFPVQARNDVAKETNILFLAKFFSTTDPTVSKKLIAEHWSERGLNFTAANESVGLQIYLDDAGSRHDNTTRWLFGVSDNFPPSSTVVSGTPSASSASDIGNETDKSDGTLPSSLQTDLEDKKNDLESLDEHDEEDWFSYRKSILQICRENPKPKITRSEGMHPLKLSVFCCTNIVDKAHSSPPSSATADYSTTTCQQLCSRKKWLEVDMLHVTKVIQVRSSITIMQDSENPARYFAHSKPKDSEARYLEITAAAFEDFNNDCVDHERSSTYTCDGHQESWSLTCHTKPEFLTNAGVASSVQAKALLSMSDFAKEKRRIRYQQKAYGITDEVSEALGSFVSLSKVEAMDRLKKTDYRLSRG